MIVFITPDNKAKYKEELNQTYRIRKKLLVDKLKWDLKCYEDKEIDQFDHEDACYLVYKDVSGQVRGVMRLTPTLSPNLTQDIFGDHVPEGFKDTDPKLWEASRFCMATDELDPLSRTKREGTYEIYAAMEEFALTHGIKNLLFVAAIPVERMMQHIGIPYKKVSKYFSTGDSKAFVGLFTPAENQVSNLIYRGKLNPYYQVNSVKEGF